MRTGRMCAVMVAVVGCAGLRCAASVTEAHAVTFSGQSRIVYTIVGANGQILTGNTTAPSGTVTTQDGTNSLSWSFGFFWDEDVRVNCLKNVRPAAAQLNTGGQLINGGSAFVLTGSSTGDDPISGELAVLTVPLSRLPTDGITRTVEQLIGDGFISPPEVRFLAHDAGPYSDTYNQVLVDLAGQFPEDGVVVYGYGTSVPVPGPGTGAALALGGAAFGRRRRG